MRRALTVVPAVLAVVAVLGGCTTAAEPSAGPTQAPSSAESSRTEALEHSPDATASGEPGPGGTGGWRTEVWRDVQLEVPADWVLGYAPMPDRAGALACGVGSPEPSGPKRSPYVGRPGWGSDVCQRVLREDLGLDRPGVWFGSRLPVGDAIAKTGLHQVTVDAGTSRVTVASKDEAVVDRILGSVEQVRTDAHGCPARPTVERGYPDEGYGDLRSFAVCVYEREGSRGWRRMWTTSLPTTDAQRLLDAAEDAGPGKPCRAEDPGQLVLLRVATDDPFGDEPLHRDLVVRPSGCASLEQPANDGRSWVRLTPATVRPWSVAGVRSYVYSNGLPGSFHRLFRPVWG